MSSHAQPTDPKPADNPFMEAVRNPAARTYALISAAGLLVAAAVLYLLFASAIAAVTVLLFGLTGLGLRWVIGPPAVVACVAYFAFFPMGVPFDIPRVSQIPDHRFAFADLLLVASAMVHLLAAFRYYSVVRAGMPFDAPAAFVKPGAKPTVRPPEPVRDPELWSLFARVGAFVLGGQLLWLFATRLKVDFRNPVPLRFVSGTLEENGIYTEPEFVPNSLSRFLLVAGVILTVSFVLWMVFWYWRLHAMNRDEARAACLDMEWTTARRELNRPETWRGRVIQKRIGTKTKRGCGTWLLMLGLPLALVLLFVVVLGFIGAFR
jgi:hypothetical protein